VASAISSSLALAIAWRSVHRARFDRTPPRRAAGSATTEVIERPCGNPGHAALTGVEQTADQTPLSVLQRSDPSVAAGRLDGVDG